MRINSSQQQVVEFITGPCLVKREYKALGMKTKFLLFDEQDQLALLRDLTEPRLEGDKDLFNQLTAIIPNWKNDLSPPQQAQALRRLRVPSWINCSSTLLRALRQLSGRLQCCWISTI